jgi:hypothetical protein
MKKRGVQPEELRHAVRDLVALSTMPAAWIGCDPHRLAEGVADLLRSALRLDVVGIRFQTSDSETCIEAWRGKPSPAFREWLREMETSPELRQRPQGGAIIVADLAATDSALRVVVAPLGVQGDCGRIVVGCSRRDFPNSLDNLLLSVAANQAVTTFQLQWAKAKLAEAYAELRNRQQKELEAAAFIQQGLMAAKIPQSAFATVAGRNLPCKEIGGDFFTVTPVDEGLAVVIADVSGKGTSAAIMASLLQGMIQADLQARLPLREIASSANKFLCTRELDLKYATLVIACVQPDGELEYINCGHIPPLVTNEGGSLVRLCEHNVPVGLLSNAEFMSAGFRLSPGDRLILVTDGITEAENADGDFYGNERLEESAQGERPLEEILASVHFFCAGRPLQDDCTILELAYVCKTALPFHAAMHY